MSVEAIAASVEEGQLLWQPSRAFADAAQITHYLEWLGRTHGLSFADYDGLWRWSVSDRDAFWRSIWDYFDVRSDGGIEEVVSPGPMEGARWFAGTRVNYAEHLLRHEAVAAPGETALCHSTEIRPVAQMSWQELGGKVRILATRLRAMGVVPGDRIVSYMPNVPETVIAMMATVAIGATWSSAAPEFGVKTVVERFGQIAPRIVFAADGYTFGGRPFDRRGEIVAILSELPSVEAVVWLPYLGLPVPETERPLFPFEDMLAGPAVSREEFAYARVAPDHPLWVLFSSGTTGLPKAIVHGHQGMVAEHLKVMTLHCNLGPGKRMFFYTTTGWMMWNAVVSALITGASAVLYDGSPVQGGIDMLWRMAADTRTTLFGASPTLVQSMRKAGVRPGELYDLSALDSVLVGGAPSTPETFQWFYENVRDDLWVTSQSGGTEVCTGLVTGLPTLPVHAAEIQCRCLGIDVHAWDEDGREVIDEVGELVVTGPMPSAPLFFWGDKDGERYHESYYATYPGIWRHGDLAKFTARGGAYIYGRSDSTLNRFGVRIGTAEIYGVAEKVPGVLDSLVICCEVPGGGFYMPMFVALEPGRLLDDALKAELAARLREDASPRHVPDEIHQAPAIPYTLTGKKMELPIRRLVMGHPVEKVVSRDAMADPALLDWYLDFASRDDVAARRTQGA
ncbi:acetoacetyl-CoA synthase [Sphingobium chlorophenolicum L-1]|uniref:Acetoacetyl-CoA synthase n=1 Tax=Sphingobium chlorophenolicum L-1 TaxID=690566 RepID=F6F211_SPHCR|nr:acetoacetate--CoA ligase [Sphingobium chlorophenolicum]AEG51577.1 acetoacetyl-CoA synthase [Sphingobium chlorophenolicum L-1]